MKLAGVSRNTFYKYKRELLEKETFVKRNAWSKDRTVYRNP